MTAQVPGRVDSYSGEYPEHLYRFESTASYTATLDAVGESEVEQFRKAGYLAVTRALGGEQVQAALDGLRSLLLDPPAGIDLEFESWAVANLNTLDGDARFDAVRKFMWFVQADSRLMAIAQDEALLTVVRRLIGSEDVVLMQDMALLKPPGGGREKPWHQDNAFFNILPGTPTLGVWIALDEATPGNGCMHVISGSHRDGPVPHFKRRDWQICDTDVASERDVVVPLPPGGALFFNGLVHHGTPANRTTTRRRAVQFHFAPRDAVRTTEEARLAVYGREGRGAEC